jgi:hypothetical protein
VFTSYQTSIRHEANTKDLDAYCIEKYNWEQSIIDLIHWNAHGKAIALLTGRAFKTTIRLIHKWLPLHTASFQICQSTARVCPFCTSWDETHHHYLTCLTTESVQSRLHAIQTIHKKLSTYQIKIYHQLIKLTITALSEWLTTPIHLDQHTKPRIPQYF